MLTAIFNFIIKIFFWLCGLVGSIVIYPIQLIIVTLFPTIGDFIVVTLNFFNTQLFPFVSFAKELFLDVSNLPRPLFSILVTFILARWAIAPAVKSIILIINTYRLLKGGMTINLQHGEKNVRFQYVYYYFYNFICYFIKLYY